MYRIVIVDDEMLVRLGIQSLLDWEAHGFHYAGDAPDGEKALALLEKTRPHIVLTDILMPNMDGLELIRRIKDAYPFMRIIVLSSHNDYDYVRQAMKLGADDYFLKASMKPDELLQSLRETAAKIDRDPQRIPEAIVPGESREVLLRKLCDDPEADVDASLLFSSPPHGYRLLLLRNCSASDEAPATRTLLNLAEQQVRKWTDGTAFPYQDREIALLIPYAAGPEADKELSLMGRDTIVAVRRFLGLSACIGVSEPFSDLKDMRLALKQAVAALQHSFYDGIERVYRYTGEEQRQQGREFAELFPKPEEDRFSQCAELCDLAGMKQIMEQVLARMRGLRSPVEINIKVFWEMIYVMERKLKSRGLELDGWVQAELPLYKQLFLLYTEDDARAWLGELFALYCERMDKLLAESYRSEIRRLIDYLQTRYAEPISMKSAARIVNMSEGYLGFVFKKETGRSVIEFVTELRLDKAAELLRQTDLHTYVIAEQVGYSNFNYFGRLFKKVKGVSPTQYRDQLKK